MPESLENLLARWSEGDPAAGEQVLALAYNELRKVAEIHFRRERPGHTLQPTALVHEVFMKLFCGKPVQWRNQSHFYAVFSKKVRFVLVDHARRKKASKRHDTQIQLGMVRGGKKTGPQYESLLTIHQILLDLEKEYPRAAQVVDLRVFGGLRDPEIAEALGISIATVKRDWTYARAELISRLRPSTSLAR